MKNQSLKANLSLYYRTLVSVKSTRKYVLTRAWTNTLPRTPSILRTRARTDTLILLHVSTKSSLQKESSRSTKKTKLAIALMETYVSNNCLLPFRKPCFCIQLKLQPKYVHPQLDIMLFFEPSEMHFRAKQVLESILESLDAESASFTNTQG